MLWRLINHQDSLQKLYLIPWWYPHHPPTLVMLIKENGRKKENDLHKSIIHCWSSSAVTVAACLYSSILKGARWQPHLIKCGGSLTYHVKKDCRWLTQKFFFLLFSCRFGVKTLASKFAVATVSRCHLWQVRVMAPAGPLSLLGLDYIPPQGLQRGKRERLRGSGGWAASTSDCFTSPPSHSFSLLCNYHQRTSVCCASRTLPSRVS